jgi:ABC-type sugar transport system permease subunit
VVQPSDQARDEQQATMDSRLKVVGAWHVVCLLACLTGLALASRSGDDELPVAISLLLRVFFTAAFAANLYAAIGVLRRWRRARTVSLVVDYLVFVVAVAAALHQFDVFTAIGDFGEGFNKAFVPFLVGSVGVLWILVARQMLAARPAAKGPQGLRTAGRVVAAVAAVWFVVVADPSGMVSGIASGLTRPLTLATLALAVAAGAACRFMWRSEVAAAFGTTSSEQQALAGLAFLSPNLIGFLFFFAGPLLFSLIVSFFEWKTTGTGRDFVGLDNYIRAFSFDLASTDAPNAGTEVLDAGYQVLMHADWFGQHWVVGARDTEFWIAMRNIIVFLVLAVPASVLPALVLSSILASRLPGMKVFRAIYFIPSVAGVIGVAIVWGQLFQSTVGWINYLILRAGEILPFVDPPAEGHPWLSSNSTALLSMVVVFAWMNFGFNTVLYLAGHQGIPKELYEAADIDGARTWQVFRRITVPQLRNTTFYVLITTSILALQLFDIVWILSTPEPGGPDNATTTPVLALYEEAFQNNNQGYASALAWVLFLVIFGFTFFQFRQQRDEATSGGMS